MKQGPLAAHLEDAEKQHWFHSRRSEKKTSAEAKTDCENLTSFFRLKGLKEREAQIGTGKTFLKNDTKFVFLVLRFFGSHHSDDSQKWRICLVKDSVKGVRCPWDLTEEWQSNYWKKKFDFLQ